MGGGDICQRDESKRATLLSCEGKRQGKGKRDARLRRTTKMSTVDEGNGVRRRMRCTLQLQFITMLFIKMLDRF